MQKTSKIKLEFFGISFATSGFIVSLLLLTLLNFTNSSLSNFTGSILFILYNLTIIIQLYNLNIKHFLIRFPIVFLLSNLLITFLTLLIRSNFPDQSLFTAGGLSYLLGFTLLIISTIFTFFSRTKKQLIPITFEKILITGIITIGLFISQLIFNQGLRIEQSINIDSYQHLTAIKEIFINGKTSLLLNDINSTFTLATYLPFFHYIFGLPISMGSQEFLLINYRILEVFFSLMSALIVFVGLNRLTKSTWLSLMGSILSIFAFESFGAYTSYFLLPQTLTALLGFSLIISNYSEKESKPLLSLITNILLILSHFFIGPFIVVINTLIVITNRFTKHLNVIYNVTIFILLVVFFASDIVSLNITSALGQIFPDLVQRESEFVLLGTLDVLNVLFRSFGFFIFPIFVITIWGIFNKDTRVKVIPMILLLLGVLITIKFPYASKLLILVHYLILIPLIFSLAGLSKLKSYLNIVVIAIMMIGLSLILKENSSTYKGIFTSPNTQSTLMSYEYEAAQQINLNYSQDTVILSDPLTMHLVEPFIEGTTGGGLFTDPVLRKLIWARLNDKSNISYKKEISKFYPGKEVVFLITPRTMEWKEKDLKFIEGYGNQIWKIKNSKNFEYQIQSL